jgi:hypothetical protein
MFVKQTLNQFKSLNYKTTPLAILIFYKISPVDKSAHELGLILRRKSAGGTWEQWRRRTQACAFFQQDGALSAMSRVMDE